MKALHILDGNCYLHAGSADFSKNFNYLGFPTCGIYHLMEKVYKLALSRQDFVVVFDSPSFRKGIDSDYKVSRKVDNKIIAQSSVIIPNLKRAGVNVMQVDGFEGDDLIANVVKANSSDRECIIYTCDYDIAMNVSNTVRIIGCRKDFPAINNANFKFVISRDGRQVPCNLLGMDKVLFGCGSDTVKSVGKLAPVVWDVFMYYLKIKHNYDPSYNITVDEKFCRKFLIGCLPSVKVSGKSIPKEVIELATHNLALVFPRYLTDDEISKNNIKLTEFEEIDMFALKDICRVFSLKKFYRKIDYYYKMSGEEDLTEWVNGKDYSSTEQLSERELNWVRTISAKYKQNGYAIDAGIPINLEAGYNGSLLNKEYDGSPRNLDEEVPDEPVATGYNNAVNGANIGEF